MDSYNSKYPLEYYSIGTPYMFYLSKVGNMSGNAATIEQIKKFGGILKQDAPVTYPKNTAAGPQNKLLNRCIGVVVDKHIKNGSAAIEVMFLGDVSGKQVYLTKKYIVAHSSGVYFDDKESVAASKSINLSGEVDIDFSKQAGKSGGITLDTGHKVSGGITLDTGNRKIGGGITIDK